ncbi:MAG: SRPBCC family protein [Bdellovibrionales bacterium]|nr:SRPBCC family protein [Bdellovibrionales bacterium]
MIKKLGVLIGFVLTLIFVVPLFLPSQFEVDRVIFISKPRADVYSKIVDLGDWNDWSPWYQMEPQARFEFQGTPGVVGSQSLWKGERIGEGSQTLTRVVDREYIETKLEFKKPSPSQAIAYFRFVEQDDGTLVTWGMKGDLPYPLGRWLGLFFKQRLGSQLQEGLDRLKTLLETSDTNL